MKTLIAGVLTLLMGSNIVLEKQILKPGVNFTCNSYLQTVQNNKLQIVNSVKNDGPTPLAVRWPEAGIESIGWKPLQPNCSDIKRNIAQEPYPLDHSEVLFGNALQYREEVSCYVDGQRRPKKTAHTERLRQDQTGKQIFKIDVISEMGDSGKPSLITFRVEGEDLSLILPTRIGEEFGLFGVPKGNQDWEIIKANSLTQAGIQTGQDEMLNWLGRTPRLKSAGSNSDFIVLKNIRHGNSEISFPVSGNDWILQTVFLVAFTPGNEGFIGLAAEMHFPR